MLINYNAKTIELTKAEMKEAMLFDSDEYNKLQRARRENPDFRIVEIKSKRKKADFANLNKKFITAYVEAHGTDEQKEHFAFISKRTVDAEGEYCEPQSFFQIKAWFLAEFPELKKARKAYREKVVSIYEAAESKSIA